MKHSCLECPFMHSFQDNSHRVIDICVFDQSENYLQEVGYWTVDCELEGFAEELWQMQVERGY